MRIVVRDHNRNRREVYNVRTARLTRNDRLHNIKDADDDKLEELEERVKTLEKKLEKLTAKPEEEDVEVEEDVDMDESDMDEEPEDEVEDEDEVVEDLGDAFGCRDSLKPRSLKSIGSLARNSSKDSIDSDDAEINAWKNR